MGVDIIVNSYNVNMSYVHILFTSEDSSRPAVHSQTCHPWSESFHATFCRTSHPHTREALQLPYCVITLSWLYLHFVHQYIVIHHFHTLVINNHHTLLPQLWLELAYVQSIIIYNWIPVLIPICDDYSPQRYEDNMLGRG